MIGEFTPVSQRGAVISIYGAIYTLAGILAPTVMGSVIQRAAVPLDGYMTGFTINAVILVASGLLGLALLWPNTERARLTAQAVQPKFAQKLRRFRSPKGGERTVIRLFIYAAALFSVTAAQAEPCVPGNSLGSREAAFRGMAFA